MAFPSLAHFVYIPLMLVVGFYAGWSLGTSSVRHEWERAEERRKQREEDG